MGKGSISFQGGLKHEGEFVDGALKENGHIRITYPEGDQYEGDWLERELSG